MRELQKTSIEEIFKTLEPTYQKFGLIKFLTMQQKIEMLLPTQQDTLNSILEKLTTQKEIKMAQKKYLKSIEKYGGEAYTLPSVIKSENHEITKKINEKIKENIEKLGKIDNKDTTKYLETLKSWDSEIETVKKGVWGVGGEKKEFIKMDKEQFDRFIRFHEKMSETYQKMELENKNSIELKNILEIYGIKDINSIKKIEEEQEKLKEIQEQIEIEKPKLDIIKEQTQELQNNQDKIIRNGKVITTQEQNINNNTLKLSEQEHDIELNTNRENMINIRLSAIEEDIEDKEEYLNNLKSINKKCEVACNEIIKKHIQKEEVKEIKKEEKEINTIKGPGRDM